ncbi:hypothetical protein [Nocardioides sp.]|uniref:hypothetical protein n=1 Tax=Nocardioides sp. TaxID=35761 RepID=UPI002CDE923F|nr:hypothetical protein [Nocardioides sp.]HXH77298.1 hypothetical protein [Nocardioides sp.]
MSLYTVRPISDRTAFTGNSIDSRFTVTWSQCTDLLYRELDLLDATDLVIECDVREQDLRLDGTLRANARAASPAVRLAFESNVGPLTYATDAFRRPTWRRGGMQEDWQHNVYAIAKSLEALRLVDRYGVTKRGEQYTGFKALPAGRAMPASHMTKSEAEATLTRWGDVGLTCGTWAERYKKARAATHPDRHAGDQTAWDQVEQAAAVLGMSR